MVQLSWYSGTGYDFFVSLYVLHHAADFGLRPSWAAGVRSRLPLEQRDFLERAQRFLRVPLTWLALQPPTQRDALDLLAALENLAAEKRLEALLLPYDAADLREALAAISTRGECTAAELEAVRAAFVRRRVALRGDALNQLCAAAARPAEFGERYLTVLRTYYQVFFAEEEGRIRPALRQALAETQAIHTGESPVDLIERLSHGVQLAEVDGLAELELAPSYWSSPLIFYGAAGPGRSILLYGVRPGAAGLVPGEYVPDGLVERLKALADPSRLRILRYLSQQPLTPSQLSRKLRLRAPTVVHHLKELRLAGLVQVMLLGEGERCYALRRDALDDLEKVMKGFLSGELEEIEPPVDGGQID